MKAYFIALIVIGFVIASLLPLFCLRDRKKKQTQLPKTTERSVNSPSAPQTSHGDVKMGQGATASSGSKDGGMVMLTGAGASIATVDAVASVACGGGDNDGGSGCGGDCGGGCGGCGGGCGD